MDFKEFLDEWNNGSDRMLVHTSGSTGKPKPIWVEKKRMAHSARTTCRFLGLKRGDTALLCLSLDYIAGKMMAVRAIEWGLNLICVEPSGHPFSFKVDELTSKQVDKLVPLVDELTNSKVDKLCDSEASNSSTRQLVNSSTNIVFTAMTPMQVYNTLQVPEERERLMQVKHLIIGGGAIDEALEADLRLFPNAVWSTYGMTETLSHIALRRISHPERCSGVQTYETSPSPSKGGDIGPQASNTLVANNLSTCQLVNSSTEKWYLPFEDVHVSLNGDGCLVIDAPGVCAETLVTNDCAQLHPDGRRFRIVGRKDNVINSGGIKIHAEEVELLLRPHLSMPFIITKATDPKFGEVVALVYEDDFLGASVQSICQAVLPKYWQPRRYLPVSHILMTETGKPRRDISLYL